ncbi:Bark storage protein A [Heracleum sosnowskyi]|uniref:Bark storage protein A n=1 Tax=Heracleum sosnowskyi TaxID=360622 RepID=A0AAD8I2T0_9APIA|nr:Bark storage protein A [Heracleum sosnowskyi]
MKVEEFVWLVWMMGIICVVNSAIPESVMRDIETINNEGSYFGIVVPNSFEMNPLLQSSSFLVHENLPSLDFAGRRFRIGTLKEKKVIIVMTGLSMVNAGITTQLLLSLFNIKGVLHFGIAGNANPQLEIGDVTIPRYWAHTGLWVWQRYGQGPNDELPLEANGDYTRTVGYLRFSNYTNNTADDKFSDNFLNYVWYQPEEIFPKNGQPEERQHAYWISVDPYYFSLAKKLEGMKLNECVNATTCLPRPPKVTRVQRGASANVFVDNAAYREFLYTKFNTTTVDMESAAVALICLQQNTPFIAFRALSDLAGGGSSVSNEADLFSPLAAQNSVDVLIQFVTLVN